MKQFTYKFFCLLGFLLIGGGNLTAQTLTKVTSLAEITESDYYILYYNGYSSYSSFNNPKAYMYESGTDLRADASTTAPSSISADSPITFNDTYKFQFLKVPETTDQFYIKSFSGKYIKGTANAAASLSETKVDETILNIVEGSNGFAIRYKCNATLYANLCGYFNNSTFHFRRHSSYQIVDGWQIYKLAGAAKEQVSVTINYYLGTSKTPIYTTTDKYDKDDKSLSDLVSVPSYVTSTYYLVNGETETEVADINAKISENATYKIVTSYNEYFKFPHTSNEYFALKMGADYLRTNFNITALNNDNKYIFATTIDGDWYNGFSIIGYNGKKLYYDGTSITWSDTDYKWKISNDMKFTIQDGTKYLAVYSTNCLASASYAAELASSDAATAILGTVTATEPEYVGQLPYETSGLTFDQIVKGIDLTNGTYYFIETAADANTVLSSSDATTTFGGSSATSATFETKASKGFNELWQYQDGYFVHANSGLKLTASALNASGTAWNKTATGKALAYKLNNGTADFTAAENDTWKFRLAKSVTISLIENNGKSYATTCAPVALTLPDDGNATTLYIEKSHTENSLSVESAKAVAANTGIYIENTSGATSATLLFAESGTAPSAETPILYGTNVTLNIPSDEHSLYRTLGFNSADKIGFFKPADSITQIPANRAFLHFTSAPTSAFYIDFDGTTTGIDTLLPAAAAELDKNAPVYDLSGRRIQGTLRTGIYLQNGRKFMVK